METQLARAVDVVMARAKKIYILIIKVNKLFSFFSSRCFLKEIENVYSVFLPSYTKNRESLGELEKAVETLACARVPTAFLILPNFHSCLYNSIETRYMFPSVPSPTRHNIHMHPYFLFAAIHPPKSSPTFCVRPRSSVGRVTVDLIRRSLV